MYFIKTNFLVPFHALNLFYFSGKPKKPSISASDMYKAPTTTLNGPLFTNEAAYFSCDLESEMNDDNGSRDTEITRYQFQIDNKINDDLMSTSKVYKLEVTKFSSKIEVRCRASNSLGFGIWSDAFVFSLQ